MTVTITNTFFNKQKFKNDTIKKEQLKMFKIVNKKYNNHDN